MVKRNWSLCAFSAGLSFMLSTVSMACLLSAFDVDCSIGALILWSLVGAVLWSISYTIPHRLLPLGLYVLTVGYLWRSGILYESMEALLFSVTTVYNRAHGWDVIGTAGGAEGVMSLFAVSITLLSARTICRGYRSLLPVLWAAVPLIPCFLAQEAMPNPLWIGFWIFAVTILLLTQPARRQKGSEKLTALLAVPVAVFVVMLLILLPQSAQEKPKAFAREMVDILQEIGIGTPDGKPMKVSGGAVELKKLGPRQESAYPVMTVTSDRGGTLYLRGCAYDTYFQNNWTNLTLIEDMYWPEEAALEEAGTVSIQTEYAMDMRYFPYYATGDQLTGVSRGIHNFSKQTAYSYEVGVLRTCPDTYTYAPNHGYTQMPTVAMRWAKPVVEQLITADMTDRQKIAAISDYVKGLAKYSLHAEKMPEGEPDFVVWFAQRANKGYCVHFASTGAILLRAAGIPTRYVTGYMVQTQASVPTQVYGKDAHAWAECFLEGVGWVPVELTPGAEPVEQPAPQPKVAGKTVEPIPILYVCSALLIGTVAAVLIRWQVHVLLRRRARKKGADRQKLLAIYSQLEELLSLDDRSPPRQLELIAEQAKFSNHPIEAESLEMLEKELKNAKKRLKKHSIIRRLHYRLILNLY